MPLGELADCLSVVVISLRTEEECDLNRLGGRPTHVGHLGAWPGRGELEEERDLNYLGGRPRVGCRALAVLVRVKELYALLF